MREILFRGKSVDNGEWVYGDLLRFIVKKVPSLNEYAITKVRDNLFSSFETHKVIPETVGQFTGLTDKNGKKIFEGDITEYSKDGYRYSIVYDEDNAMYRSKDYIDGTLGYINCGKDEVIGNIHDNPELLKEL